MSSYERLVEFGRSDSSSSLERDDDPSWQSRFRPQPATSKTTNTNTTSCNQNKLTIVVHKQDEMAATSRMQMHQLNLHLQAQQPPSTVATGSFPLGQHHANHHHANQHPHTTTTGSTKITISDSTQLGPQKSGLLRLPVEQQQPMKRHSRLPPKATPTSSSNGDSLRMSVIKSQANLYHSMASLNPQQQARVPVATSRDYVDIDDDDGNNCDYHCNAQPMAESSLTSLRSPPTAPASLSTLEALGWTDDPVLLRWLEAMRFHTELECLTSLHAKTLAMDEHSAAALSVRGSQVAVQALRAESGYVLDYVDCLIDMLPLDVAKLAKFSLDFSQLYAKLVEDTRAALAAAPHSPSSRHQRQPMAASTNYHQTMSSNELTIVNCTPKKHQFASHAAPKPSARATLAELAAKMRDCCCECLKLIQQAERDAASPSSSNMCHAHPGTRWASVDNGAFEAALRRIKELYGKYVEVTLRQHCANIVSALQYDFSAAASDCGVSLSLERIASTCSLRPWRPFESSSAQIPLKWALIALWQLSQDDPTICKVLTEKWVALEPASASYRTPPHRVQRTSPPRAPGSGAQRRLDYSTKYDQCEQQQQEHPLRSDYYRLSELCSSRHQLPQMAADEEGAKENCGALMSQLRSRCEQPSTAGCGRQMSTIELLIEIIISQPNKHERLDMMNFIHEQAKHAQLVDIDVDEWDQSVSAAIYTSNQYKIAALRILNHLCVNELAVKTILKCFSTPPRDQGQPTPENKIIRSIFECHKTSQEHIYQNETMFRAPAQDARMQPEHKRPRQLPRGLARHTSVDSDDYSDYRSRSRSQQSASLVDGDFAPLQHHEWRPRQHRAQQQQRSGASEGDDDVVIEVLRLLVRLTSPFYKSNQLEAKDYYNLIGQFSIDSLVKYLTNIIKTSSPQATTTTASQGGSRDMLLLSLSVLANISFVNTACIKKYTCCCVILEALQLTKERARDLELRDQTVTILANMADKNMHDVIESGGLSFLLGCLESCPKRMASFRQRSMAANHWDEDSPDAVDASELAGKIDNTPRARRPIVLTGEQNPLADSDSQQLDDGQCNCNCDDPTQLYMRHSTYMYGQANEFGSPIRSQHQALSSCLASLDDTQLAAMERIHQKTAIAFARMSTDPSVVQMILKLGGTKRLIELCKFSHKRNHSDTVLVACIAALRKMAKSIDESAFKQYNALDLIALEPMQALEIYGNIKKRQADHYII